MATQAEINQKKAELYDMLTEKKPAVFKKAEVFASSEKKFNRVAKFAQAYNKSKVKEIEDALAAGGWVETSNTSSKKDGVRTFNKSGNPVKLTIDGDKFTVTDGTKIVINKESIEGLPAFLSKPVSQGGYSRK